MGEPCTVTITGCSFQPEQGDEVLTDRTAVVSRWRWFGPPGADVSSSDRIEFEGAVYDVDGSVQSWRGLGLAHKTALLRRADG